MKFNHKIFISLAILVWGPCVGYTIASLYNNQPSPSNGYSCTQPIAPSQEVPDASSATTSGSSSADEILRCSALNVADWVSHACCDKVTKTGYLDPELLNLCRDAVIDASSCEVIYGDPNKYIQCSVPNSNINPCNYLTNTVNQKRCNRRRYELSIESKQSTK